MNRLYIHGIIIVLVLLVAVSCQKPPVPAPPVQSPSPTPITLPEPAPAPAPPPPVPAPEPTKPLPEPPKKQPEIMTSEEVMRNLEYDVPLAYQEMLNVLNRYPLYLHEDVLIHKFIILVGGRGSYDLWFPVPAEYVSEANKHMENASSLVKNKKLPDELRPRDVSVEEIAGEMAMALPLLEKQLSFSFLHQENVLKWCGEQDNPSFKSEATLSQITKFYDRYREDVSEVITKLEFILSYCDQALQKISSASA